MTNTSADIRDAWEAAVLTHATVTTFTPNIYLYDVLADSQFQVSGLYYEGAINFLTCKVQRRSEPLMMNQTRYTFEVRLEYYLQQTDMSESTFNTCQDRLEAIDTLVRTELTGSWSGTVDYYQGGQPTRIDAVPVDTRACWRGGFTYTAFKTT